MDDAPHPLVAPIVGLVGVWTGSGTGRLPGGDEFRWDERFEIGHAGTPGLWLRQRTRRPDGSPFHAEDGWVRVPPERQPAEGPAVVELAVTSPTGVLEALAGTATARAGHVEIDATSTAVVGTPAAATVHRTRRRWQLDGDELRVDFWMATPDHPDTFHHLSALLGRSEHT